MNDFEIYKKAPEGADSEQLSQYLDKACKGNADLRAQVEALFSAEEKAAGFLDESPLGAGTTMEEEQPASASAEEHKGELIGRYKLLEKLGEGGFGSVWAAEQREPVRRRVALKVIKLGMDSKQVVARFEAERQALALMDHPNIAKVLDAGATDSGRPYFVMELVKGIPVTEYCEKENLSINDRLELFIKTAQAIQHAHQKGIIHRDIKPSNIMVTLHDGVPVPKVIDFGIAKATQQELTEKTIYTQYSQFIGTPAYMSPEQAELSGLDIDTRSDIYSLGVLLYELLTGATPFDTKELMMSGLDEMRKIIRERDPVKPSTRVNQTATTVQLEQKQSHHRSPLASDLDWIVLKCLEKDRSRRYESANGIALDIRRHLSDELIIARPPSTSYKIQKAWRRNKLIYSAGLIVTLALIGGMGISIWQYQEANTARIGAVEAQKGEEIEKEGAQKARDDLQIQKNLATSLQLQAQERAYVAEINAAHQAFQNRKLGRAIDLLEQQIPKTEHEKDLRGMEWYYLKHLCRSDASVSFEDQGSVALDFSEDGKLLAYTLNKILIRDVRSKEVIEKLEFAASSLEFVPKQNLLATANHDACILWNTSTWSPLKTLPNAIHPIAFSPDGTKMLSGTKTGYRLWDTKSWKPLAECSIPHRNGGTFNGEKINRHVGFSSDGSIVMTGAEKGNQKFQLWNGHNLDPIPIEGALGENSSVSASFLGKGPYLLTGSMLGDVTLWNVLNGEKIQSKQGAHLGFVTDISLSNDGMHFLTVSSDRTLQVWDLNRFEPIKLLRGHHGEIWTAGWSPDNLTIASGAFDGTTQLWNAHLEDEEYSIETGIIGYNYEPDGESLVGFFDQDDWLVRWDFESSPKSLFSEIDPMQTTGIQERHISKHDYKFAIGRTNGMIEIWDRKTGQLEFEKQYASSEMNRIIASPEKGVWAVSTEQRLFSFSQTHPENVTEFKGPIHDVRLLEYSPDGRLLAAVGNEQQVFVWKIGHPDQTKSLSLSIPDSIGSLQFSNKGDLIAAGTVNSNRIYLWNVPDFDLYAELEGHIQGVNSIVFSLDDQTIITTSLDRNIIFWHVPTRQEMLTLFNDRPVMNLRISPDDQSFVGIELDLHKGDHRTRVWHAPRP